jgi:ATP-binding cassette, subfamily C, bacterial CydD
MRPLDARLLRQAPSARRFLEFAAALACAGAAATIAQAALLADVVVAAFLHHRTIVALTPQLVALAGLALVRAAIAWAFEGGGRLAAVRVTRELRTRVLAHVVEARPGRLPTGEVAIATTEGARALEPYFARFLPQLLLAAVAPPAILVWVAFHDLTSALIMAATLPLIPIFGILIGKTAQARARARWQALHRMSAHFLDVVGGLPTLRAYRRGPAQTQVIAATSDAFRAETMSTLRVAFLSAFVLELAATLGTAVIAVEIGVRLVEGTVALQPALAVLVLAPELYGPLRQLAGQFHASTDGLAAADQLLSLLELEPTAARPQKPRSAVFGTVAVEAVTAGYEGRGVVVGPVSFSIELGERLALAGASGAGKTTLLSLLLRFADPVGGRISVDGVDLQELDATEWRRLVAWLPQRPRLEPGTVADAIGPGLPVTAIHAAAEAAGAAQLLERVVGERGAGLSAGEVRRVALARALARDAPFLLLDEPTAHLDGANAAIVTAALAALPSARTVVVATHDPGVLEVVDRVVELVTHPLRELAESAA